MGINAIVGQSGGPTCVINSSLAGVFSACRKHGVQHVYGMRHGVQGLLKDDVVNLTDVLSAPGSRISAIDTAGDQDWIRIPFEANVS